MPCRYFGSTNGDSSAVDLVWSLEFVVTNSLGAVDLLHLLHSLLFNIFGAPSRCMLELFLLSFISINYRFSLLSMLHGIWLPIHILLKYSKNILEMWSGLVQICVIKQ